VLLALTCAAAAAAQEEPTAGDLWFRLLDAYARVALYRDQIELAMSDGAVAGAVRFTLETRADAGAVRLTVTPAAGPESSGTAVAAQRRVESATWERDLERAIGAGALQGLPSLALLAGGPRAVEEPEALAYEGRDPCGEESCHLLSGSAAQSGATWRLWLGERDDLVRRSEVELRRGAAVRVFRAVVRRLPESPELPGEVYTESIDVALSTLVVRVRDRSGRAVPGLEPADFRVRLGRQEVEVTAAEWVGEAPPPQTLAELTDPALLEAAPPPGRRILFFVQTSLLPSRVAGQMQLRRHAFRFLDELRATDVAAVVSFDSHLKLRADFTADHGRLREALDASVRPGPEPLLRQGGDPTLLRSFDRSAARRAATPEAGLEVAARALIPIDGEKVVVFLGWGLGRFTSTGVEMIPQYGDALRALDAARASVFTIDVTQADYHSLEIGLQQVAEDTGGTYTKSNVFPGIAMDELQATLGGHYVLYFRRPEGADGPQPVRVELRDRSRGELLVPEGVLR
jgi:VWFA-related protein